VAITSLLTFGALTGLAEPGSDDYVALGLLLALIVGAVRVAVGALRAGVIAYLMSRPMLIGFIPAATLLILASQLPSALGAAAPAGSILEQAAWAVAHPGSWEPASLALSAAVLVLMFGGRRITPLFPGVLVAVALAIGVSLLLGYDGDRVGSVDPGLPPVSLALPWSEAGGLLLAGVVIALVGFAEPASIARAFAIEDRQAWSPDREFVSQGAANVAAGLTGGFPIGGSFSRSSLNRFAGATTRWSGAVTGVAVLLFLPLAFVLSPLPRAVLGAIVIGAVLPLIRIPPILRLWRFSKPQFLVAGATFGLTLALAPRIERAVLIGIALALVIHLWRELRVDLRSWSEDGALHLRPAGVLWFGAAQDLQDSVMECLAGQGDAHTLVLHLDGIGRLDVTGALAVRTVLAEGRRLGLDVKVAGVQSRDRRLVEGVVEPERDPLGE
jgi:sulfate permease, SulP family